MKYLKMMKGGIIMNEYEYMCKEYGKENVDYWLENVKMKELWRCLDAVSNNALVDSYSIHHREHDLNCLEMVLQGKTGGLWASVTYGTQPNYTCYCQIGHLTNRKYGNFGIAMFLIEEKMDELKQWLLENHKFSEREIRLLHYDVQSDLNVR